MGLAELLATLGIPYDSPAAVALAGRLFRVIAAEARLASSRPCRPAGWVRIRRRAPDAA